ncbi:MAG: HrpB1 family type III secretion system apparatus protein [Pararobbsia sp.]
MDPGRIVSGMVDVLWAGVTLDALSDMQDLLDAIAVLCPENDEGRVAIAWWHVRRRAWGEALSELRRVEREGALSSLGTALSAVCPLCAERSGLADLRLCGGLPVRRCNGHPHGAGAALRARCDTAIAAAPSAVPAGDAARGDADAPRAARAVRRSPNGPMACPTRQPCIPIRTGSLKGLHSMSATNPSSAAITIQRRY